MAKLVVQTDAGAPVAHELGVGIVTVGRELDNTIIVADASVSRHHAEIISRDGTSTLRDLDSANGSRINGEFVTEAPLKKGDTIYFGAVPATFVIEPAAAPPAPPSVPKVSAPPPTLAARLVEPAATLLKPASVPTVSAPPPAPLVVEPAAVPPSANAPKVSAPPSAPAASVVEPAAALPAPPSVPKVSTPTPAPARAAFVVEPAAALPPSASVPKVSAPAPRPTRSPLLIGGAIFLVAACAVAAFLFPRPEKREVRLPPKPAAIVDPKPAATRLFWDRLKQIESAGNQTAHDFPFGQYPLLPNGLYDFQHMTNGDLGSLLDSLMERARYLSRVSQDFATLDQRSVDADLIAYGKDLRAEWEGAASLDFNAANLVWAVHVRRLQFPTTGSSARGLFGASAEESGTEQENQASVDGIAKLVDAWLVQRDRFLVDGAEVAARQKEVNSLLTRRYRLEFE